MLPSAAAVTASTAASPVESSGALAQRPREAPVAAPAVPGAALMSRVARPPAVLFGADAFLTEVTWVRRVAGKRLAVLTHAAGVTSQGETTLDALIRRKEFDVVSILAPEHGLIGDLPGGKLVAATTYAGRPVHSLYGQTRSPTWSMLSNADCIIVDLQDVGTRFYTYISSLYLTMAAAASHHLPIFVLDRPNPLGGERAAGPLPMGRSRSFTSIFPLPLLHGLTIGELARLFNEEDHLGAELYVVPMRGWKREMLFGDTGLPWVPPSPNIPTWETAQLYPALELLGLAERDLSVGLGTAQPFRQLGAPWLHDPRALCARLNELGVAGVRFLPTAFTPTDGPYHDERCLGAFLLVTDLSQAKPLQVTLALLHVLHSMYPSAPFWKATLKALELQLETPDLSERLDSWPRLETLLGRWQGEAATFFARHDAQLLYGCFGENAGHLGPKPRTPTAGLTTSPPFLGGGGQGWGRPGMAFAKATPPLADERPTGAAPSSAVSTAGAARSAESQVPATSAGLAEAPGASSLAPTAKRTASELASAQRQERGRTRASPSPRKRSVKSSASRHGVRRPSKPGPAHAGREEDARLYR
ncbi:MAG: DUF1343 domain-containing protein [Candidatus Riflebacteria bacterium]|nr:DUF1343 domain-containing protein [Candidatus Riflebacteria bacterium]